MTDEDVKLINANPADLSDEQADERQQLLGELYFAAGSVLEFPRPDYVHCVMDEYEGRQHLTWCGRKHWNAEFLFLNVGHAALNGRNKGRLVVCRECRKAIEKALANGWEGNP